MVKPPRERAHGLLLCFFGRSGSVTMSANVRAVNANKNQLHVSVFAGLLQQEITYLLQNAVLLVTPEAMVDALIGRVML